MIKRLNKKIAMLVATASIVSLVPSIGANASTTSTKRLESQDGEIDNAVAFKDGKYIFQGYQGDDESGLYYYNGSNAKTLKDSDDDEDLSDADLVSKYGDTYVKIDDNDEYLVDLSTGKVSDDDSSSFTDDAKTALKKQLKKADDRYDVENESDITSFTELTNKNFGDVYYQYEAKGDDGKSYTGFTNKSGKYIDANYTANIYAYSSAKGKVVKVEKFNDDDDSKLTANLDSIKVIAQDKDYIYALSKITVKDSNISANTDVTTSSAVTVGTSQSVTGTYIQKIAKAQGTQEDDAYIPSSVASYQVNNGIFDDDDADKADTAITDATDYFVKDGTLYAVKAENDKITVTKLVLKKTNDKFTTAPSGVSADTKQSIQIVQADDDEDTDMETSTSYDVDSDGNLWIINNGKIKEYNGSSFDTVYSCDSSFDTLSVYDKNNLVVWAKDKEEYATVTGKSDDSGSTTKATESEATEAVVKAETSKLQADVDSAKALVATLDDGTVKTDLTNRLDAVQKSIPTTGSVVNVGWNKNAVTGQWTYADANKNILKSQWVQDKGVWYYLNADGSMATGWNKVGQAWYYLNANGSMATGWIQDKGDWYYLNADGSMATGWLYDSGAWYFLTSSGTMKTGWVQVEGYWYFLNSNGSMASNTTVGGYKLGADGAWIQ